MGLNTGQDPKLLQYLPLIVLAAGTMTSYVSLQERVSSIQTVQNDNNKTITSTEVKLRLDNIQSDITEIKQDIKHLGDKKK